MDADSAAEDRSDDLDPGRDWLQIPVRRPMLMTRLRRDWFEEIYRSTLGQHQKTFAAYVPVVESAEIESELGERIARIVRSDAARDSRRLVLQRARPANVNRLMISLAKANRLFLIAIPAIVFCFAVPITIADGLTIATLSMGGAALVLAIVFVALLLPVVMLIDVLFARHGAGDSLATVLAYGTVLIALCWLALTMRPPGYEILGGGAAGSAVALGVLYLIGLWDVTYTAAKRRHKLTRDPEAEIIESLMLVVESLSPPAPDFRFAAAELSYAADVVNTAWRSLIPVVETPAVQARWRTTIDGVAAELRDLGSRAAFPDAATAGALRESLRVALTALVTRHYGDLPVSEPDGTGATWPRLGRFWRGLGSLVAALVPITLLLVLPWLFGVELDERLFGTLLTISVGWVVLYVISWLDPKRAASPGGSVPSLLGQLPK